MIGERFAYLALLCLSIGGLAMLDKRFRLAYYYDAKRTARTVLASVVFFLLWDLSGIALGIFFIGDSPYLSGLLIAPEVPIEEIFFLVLLSYQSLILFRGFKRIWPHI